MSLVFVSIIILILLSAFFSASEVAFFSIPKFKMKRLEKENQNVAKLVKRSRQLLITILICNTFVNVSIAAVAASFAVGLAERFNADIELFVAVQIVLTTIVLLIFGELFPKIIAYSKAEKLAKFSSSILVKIVFILYPLVWILEQLSRLFSAKKERVLTSDDFKNVLSSKGSSTQLGKDEKVMIHNIFKFTSTTASEIMVPRVDIAAIEVAQTTDVLRDIILSTGHSRIPVYSKVIDSIIGFVYSKDLILGGGRKQNLTTLLRKPIFVTENMKIDRILNIFKTKKMHIAVVLDEYGGTSGLITMEDILEEIVGEIFDEYDEAVQLIERQKDGSFLVNGMCPVDKFASETKFPIQNGNDYDTIAEYLIDLINGVPKKGEVFVWQNVEFTFCKVEAMRIKKLKAKSLKEIKN